MVPTAHFQQRGGRMPPTLTPQPQGLRSGGEGAMSAQAGEADEGSG